MVRTILVPLDGSTFGEHALPMALSLARRTDAVVHLVHVHQPVPPASVAGVAVMDSLDLHMRQDEQAYLADVTRRVREHKDVPVVTALLEGEVAIALREYAAQHKCEFVVMSTHGRGAMSRFWLGSVADDLLRQPPCPVLLIRPHEGKPELRREPQIKSILVPLDGTPLAEQALEPAVAMTKPFQGSLTLLRVIKPALRGTYLPEGTTMEGITHSILEQIDTLQQQLKDEARNYLQGVAEKLRARGVEVMTRVVIDEQPGTAILQEADACYADLIAMATHGRRGFKRLFLGSVADKVVRGGTVPVLLHKPAQ